MADDLAVDPRNGFKLVRPVVALVRPGEPSRPMGFPFRRHAETKLGGNRGGGSFAGHKRSVCANRRPVRKEALRGAWAKRRATRLPSRPLLGDVAAAQIGALLF